MSNPLNKLAAEFNRYFTSSNGVDVPAKVSVSCGEWRALFAAIQQADAQQPAAPEPVLTVEKEPDYWDKGHFHFYEGNKPYIDPTKVWCLPIGTKLYTHPAPSVPADVVRDAERYRWLKQGCSDKGTKASHIAENLYGFEWDAAIDAAMLAASQVQKGGE